MKTKLISISVDGLEVIGKITRRENYYLEVEILQPYVNWKNYRSVSPVILRNSPNPFINSWKEMSEEILLNSYKKLKSIDENLDSVVKDYEDLNEEINAVSVLDNDLKKRIIKKLRDQFFRKDLFVSSVTGLIATYHDEAIIEKIINTYRSEKKKIYLAFVPKVDFTIENKVINTKRNRLYIHTDGVIQIGGSLIVSMIEPMTGQVFIKRRINLSDFNIQEPYVYERQTSNGSGGLIGTALDKGSAPDMLKDTTDVALTKAINKFYAKTIPKINSYLDKEEILSFKKDILKLKGLKRF
jgi:hypothetical protein